MLKFVVPMFADVFQRFGGKLPFITAFILQVSKVLDDYFLYGIILMILLFLFLMLSRDKPWFRRIGSAFILKIPVVGEIVKKSISLALRIQCAC